MDFSIRQSCINKFYQNHSFTMKSLVRHRSQVEYKYFSTRKKARTQNVYLKMFMYLDIYLHIILCNARLIISSRDSASDPRLICMRNQTYLKIRTITSHTLYVASASIKCLHDLVPGRLRSTIPERSHRKTTLRHVSEGIQSKSLASTKLES